MNVKRPNLTCDRNKQLKQLNSALLVLLLFWPSFLKVCLLHFIVIINEFYSSTKEKKGGKKKGWGNEVDENRHVNDILFFVKSKLVFMFRACTPE